MEAETVPEETQKEGTENVPEQAAAIAPAMAKPQEPAKRPRREDRNRKDDRNYELFMKAVNAAPPAEQIGIASQKYLAMLDENKKMQFYIKQSDKRHALILKDKEMLQLEFNKTILLKSKLENLCRELQKQNKSIKDESLHKIREEEERRKETQAKFQTTLAEISTLLQQNSEKNTKLRDDNISMTEKFKTVVQQYQLREDQVDKMSKQMELESQLNAAKMQKASLEHQADRERLMAEMELLRAAVVEYRAKVNEMQGTETGLRGQLAVYTDKYDEFQSALMKSNQVFGGFKDQMEKMSKKIKKLEKESLSWKQRWESSQSALLDMCGERQASDSRLVAIQRQLAHMQSLCRTLQGERTVLLGALKEHNIERPPLPAPTPAPAPAPEPVHTAASDAKVDAMAVNCAQLRQSLAHLQSQLNVLTTQQTQQADEPAQAEKPKKIKTKRNKAKKAVVEEIKELTEESSANDKMENESVPTENDVVTPENAPEVVQIAETTNTEIESVDLAVEKVDESVLESLMQAINIANVNLRDLEVVDNDMNIEEVLEGESRVEKITDNSESMDTKETDGMVQAKEVIEIPKEREQEVTDSLIDAESPKASPKKNESPKDSPKKNETPKDSPKKSESLNSPKKNESPKDSPKKSESLDSPKKSESQDSPKKNKSLDSPKKSESLDSPKKSESLDSPKKSESLDSPKKSGCLNSSKKNASPKASTKNNESPKVSPKKVTEILKTEPTTNDNAIKKLPETNLKSQENDTTSDVPKADVAKEIESQVKA